jgi:hypothetical protein
MLANVKNWAWAARAAKAAVEFKLQSVYGTFPVYDVKYSISREDWVQSGGS